MRLLPRLTGSFASCCAKVLDAEPQIWQYGLAFRDSWRHGRKTPSGPRGSSGIRTMLVEMFPEGIFVSRRIAPESHDVALLFRAEFLVDEENYH